MLESIAPCAEGPRNWPGSDQMFTFARIVDAMRLVDDATEKTFSLSVLVQSTIVWERAGARGWGGKGGKGGGGREGGGEGIHSARARFRSKENADNEMPLLSLPFFNFWQGVQRMGR